MEVKKIAVLLPSLQMGGAERLVLQELVHLQVEPTLSFQLHVVHEAGPLEEEFRKNGIDTIVWNAPHRSFGTLLSYIRIIRYLRGQKVDLVHVHLLNHIGPLLVRAGNLVPITTIHSDVDYGALTRFSLRQNRLLFACGARVHQNLRRFVPERTIVTLNNAVEVKAVKDLHRAAVLAEMGVAVKSSTQVVVSVGRLVKIKGYDLLVDAFEKVLQQHPDCLLLIAGDGPEKGALQRRIAEKGLQNQVHLLGLVREIPRLLFSCDLYVNSSRCEGLPLSILEAMASKKPVVATNVGGNGEVIRDGETGILVAPERPDLLADGILKILEDQRLAQHLGSNAFLLYSSSYTLHSHCSILKAQYLTL